MFSNKLCPFSQKTFCKIPVHYHAFRPIPADLPCFYWGIPPKQACCAPVILHDAMFSQTAPFMHPQPVHNKKAAPFGTAFGDVFGYSAEDSINLMRFS